MKNNHYGLLSKTKSGISTCVVIVDKYLGETAAAWIKNACQQKSREYKNSFGIYKKTDDDGKYGMLNFIQNILILN